ncbi:MAG: threonine/serine exporter family protein [Clostridiales bacterium]|nr:threonine/serine exporter family protein [Clostridiales bacterium]
MKKMFEFSVELAVKIVENGGEISRAEETVLRICKAAGASETNVFIIPSLIYANAVFKDERYSASKRIYKTNLNLGKLEESNNISRMLCGDSQSKTEINYQYSKPLTALSILLATGSFCIYFGGNIMDALFSGLIGIAISFIPYAKGDFNIFSKTLIDSTVSAFLAFLPNVFGLNTNADKIMTGTIMLLIPGMSIGSSIKDLMSGNLIAGILQFTEALMVALAIALGFSAAVLIFGGDYLA